MSVFKIAVERVRVRDPDGRFAVTSTHTDEDGLMNGVLLLAGPPAVGHNTVADLLARGSRRMAVVDGDDLRAMVSPPAMPGGGRTWADQYDLSIRNLCSLAVNFDRAGVATVLLDVVEPETVPLYRLLLNGVSRFDLVLLTADDDTLLARDRGRDPHPDDGSPALTSWHRRIRQLRSKLDADAHLYDARIDTSRQTPDQSAEDVRRAIS